ncbi:MAG: flagellar biosynthesis protein FliR [Candidatus Atribacteria bacterium]|jgi:flagellar biosynthetic protein FliR|nr:flagellar biosynthesis protein FliR [Candidatus Atribacteria bacterium]
MSYILEVLANNILPFILVWVRFLGLFLMAPVLNSRFIPPLAKIGLAFLVAVMVFPLVDFPQSWMALDARYLMAVFSESLTGFVLGLIVSFVFACIQIAGEIIDFEMGFSYVNVVDPLSNLGASVVGQFYLMLATLYYLGIDGHHLALRALVHSFRLLPPGSFLLGEHLLAPFLNLVQEVMVVALQIAAPVMAALFLTNLTLAIISRAIPQMNVFVVGLPLNLGIGIWVILSALPYFLPVLGRVTELFVRALLLFLSPAG